MKEIKKLKINIFGQSYSISTDEQEDQIKNAAKRVDVLMNHISKSTGMSDGYKISVLAALQLADTLNKKEKELDLWLSDAKRLHSLFETKA
jgi:cell division protein ZapA (FtsZ GTPase activity inhibitor)